MKRTAICVLAVFSAAAFACSEEPTTSVGSSGASELVANGDGYSFRRVPSQGTELLLEQGFGERSFDEVISVIARKGAEPVGPVDVMVLNEPIEPREWVDKFYKGLEQHDISAEVGANALLFTGSAIGAVMECDTDAGYALIRGSATGRAPLVALMKELAARCD